MRALKWKEVVVCSEGDDEHDGSRRSPGFPERGDR